MAPPRLKQVVLLRANWTRWLPRAYHRSTSSSDLRDVSVSCSHTRRLEHGFPIMCGLVTSGDPCSLGSSWSDISLGAVPFISRHQLTPCPEWRETLMLSIIARHYIRWGVSNWLRDINSSHMVTRKITLFFLTGGDLIVLIKCFKSVLP